jgi:phosphoglycolate phosphatase-like HAD superfamily hydrolase
MIVFFDLDGPILDVSDKYYRLYLTIIEEFGGQPLTKAEYWELKRQRISEFVILRLSGLTGDETDFTSLRRSRIEQKEYLTYDRVWPEAEEALRKLHFAELPLVLVTLRHNAEALAWQLDQLRIDQFFSRILSTPAVEGAKDQAGTKTGMIMNILGMGPLEGWFVGDTETDILAGRELGVRTAAVTFGIRTIDKLLSFSPDRIISVPGELDNLVRDILEARAERTTK